jgi:hypothetical protein
VIIAISTGGDVGALQLNACPLTTVHGCLLMYWLPVAFRDASAAAAVTSDGKMLLAGAFAGATCTCGFGPACR